MRSCIVYYRTNNGIEGNHGSKFNAVVQPDGQVQEMSWMEISLAMNAKIKKEVGDDEFVMVNFIKLDDKL